MIILRQREFSGFGRFFEGYGNDKWDPSRSTGGVNPSLLEEAKKYKRLSDMDLCRPLGSSKPASKKLPLSMKLIREKRKKS